MSGDNFGILSFGAYLPRARLQRKAIAAANGWFAPGLRGPGQGRARDLQLGRGLRSRWGSRRRATAWRVSIAARCRSWCWHRPPLRSTTGSTPACSPTRCSCRPRCAPATRPEASAPAAARSPTALRSDARTDAGHRRRRAQGEGGQPAGDALRRRRGRAARGQRRPGRAAARRTQRDGRLRRSVPRCERHIDYAWEERWMRDEGYLKIVPRAVAELLKRCA